MKDLFGNAFGRSSGGGYTPKVARCDGTYAAAAWGLGYYDPNSSNAPTLLVAFEIPGTGHC